MGNLKAISSDSLLKKIETNNLHLAEKEFETLSLEKQIVILKKSGFNENIALLCKDAKSLIPKLGNFETLKLFENAGFGASSLHDCVSTEQFMFILDTLSWVNITAKNNKPAAYTHQLEPALGIGWILGIKSSKNAEWCEEILNALGADLIYCFMRPYVKYVDSELSMHLAPNVGSLEITSKAYVNRDGENHGALFSDSDVRDFLKKVIDVTPDIFSELCHKIYLETEADVATQYFNAAERNDWYQEKTCTEQEKTAPVMHPIDLDIDAI